MDLETYIVTDEDTLEGIAFKRNMTTYTLIRINNLHREVPLVPGMALQVQKVLPEDFTPLPLPSIPTRGNLHIWAPMEGTAVLVRLPVHYCVPQGEVRGILEVTHHVIMFNPHVLNSVSCEIFTGSEFLTSEASQYQSLIDLFDISTCSSLSQESLLETKTDLERSMVFLKIALKPSFCKEKREEKVPMVIFRMSCVSEAMFPIGRLEVEEKVEECCRLISKAVSEASFHPSHQSQTQIPYFEWTDPEILSLTSALSMSVLKFSHSFELYAEDESDFLDFVTYPTSSTLPIAKTHAAPTSDPSTPAKPFQINGFKSDILNPERYEAIIYNLPGVLQLRAWEMIFSLPTHGCSFNTFYRQSAMCGPSVLLIEDAEHHVFGSFAPETWMVKKLYYGTGEAFLFTFHTGNQIKCFFPTFVNEYYMMSDFESLAMGTGDESGLFIYKDFMNGSSYHCATYDNEVLSGSQHFIVIKLELWSLG